MEVSKKMPVDYISPTSLKLFLSDPVAFYMQYVLKCKREAFPAEMQRAMDVGTVFDSLCKRTIADAYGVRCADTAAKITDDAVRRRGEYLYKIYCDTGAMADLMLELKAPAFDIKLEFDIQGGSIERNGTVVPLRGIPDLSFRSADGRSIVGDFKTRGAFAENRISPTKGYRKYRPWPATPSASRYKEYFATVIDGIECNLSIGFADANRDWAIASVFYYALLGEDTGRPLVGFVEEVTPWGVSSLRLPISKEFQTWVWDSVFDLWERLTSGWFFKDKTWEESCAICESLEKMSKIDD